MYKFDAADVPDSDFQYYAYRNIRVDSKLAIFFFIFPREAPRDSGLFKKFLRRESSIEHAFFSGCVARRLATDFRRLLSRREAPRDRF